MRIAIDCRFIGRSINGIGRYNREIVKGLDKNKEINLIIFTNNDIDLELQNTKIIRIKSKLFSISEQIELPILLRKVKPDLFHTPSFVSPIIQPCKTIMTIHDLIHLRFSKDYTLLHKLYYKLIVKTAAKQADIIITPSNTSKKDIHTFLGIDNKKIFVIYHGISENFSPREDFKNILIKKYNINYDYILYVGNLKTHKNINTLIETYCNLIKDGKIKHKLIITYEPNKKIQNFIHNFGIEENIVFIRDIPEKDLPYIYSGCSVFVYPSLCEGFGFPPLEAMSCGVPVISSNAFSLPEVLDFSALTFDPNDKNMLYDLIYRVINDDELRRSLIQMGLNHSKKFRWDRTINQLIGVYKSLICSKSKNLC